MLNCLSVHSFLYPSTLSVSFSLQPGLQLLSSLKSVRFSPLLSLCSFIPDPVLFVIITGHVPLPPLLLWPHSALLSSLIVSRCPTCCPTPSLAWCCHGVDLCCQHEGLQLPPWVIKQWMAHLNKLELLSLMLSFSSRAQIARTPCWIRLVIGDSHLNSTSFLLPPNHMLRYTRSLTHRLFSTMLSRECDDVRSVLTLLKSAWINLLVWGFDSLLSSCI